MSIHYQTCVYDYGFNEDGKYTKLIDSSFASSSIDELLDHLDEVEHGKLTCTEAFEDGVCVSGVIAIRFNPSVESSLF